jgi:NCAIR mutase (PurE)-related protein
MSLKVERVNKDHMIVVVTGFEGPLGVKVKYRLKIPVKHLPIK